MVAFWLLAFLSLCVPGVAVGTQKPVQIKNVLLGDFSIDVDAGKQTIDIAPKSKGTTSEGDLPVSQGSQGDETCDTCKAVVDLMKKIAAQPGRDANDIREDTENVCYDMMERGPCRSVAAQLHHTSANDVVQTLRDQTVPSQALCARFNMCPPLNDKSPPLTDKSPSDALIDLGQMLRRRAKLNAGHGALTSKTATFDAALSRKDNSGADCSGTKAHVGFVIDVSQSIHADELKLVGDQLKEHITQSARERLRKVSIFAYSSVLYHVADGACVGADCSDGATELQKIQDKLTNFSTDKLKQWVQSNEVKVHSVMDYLAENDDARKLSPEQSEEMARLLVLDDEYPYHNHGTMTKSSVVKASELMDKVHQQDRQGATQVVMQSVLVVLTDGKPWTNHLWQNQRRHKFFDKLPRVVKERMKTMCGLDGASRFSWRTLQRKVRQLSQNQEEKSSSRAAMERLTVMPDTNGDSGSCDCGRTVPHVPKAGYLVPLDTKMGNINGRIRNDFPGFTTITRRRFRLFGLDEVNSYLSGEVLSCDCDRPVDVHIAFDGSFSMDDTQFGNQMTLVKDLVNEINAADPSTSRNKFRTFLYQYGPGVQQHAPGRRKEYWDSRDNVNAIQDIRQMGGSQGYRRRWRPSDGGRRRGWVWDTVLLKGTCSYGAIETIMDQINGQSNAETVNVVVFIGDGDPWHMNSWWRDRLGVVGKEDYWHEDCGYDGNPDRAPGDPARIQELVGGLKNQTLAVLPFTCGGPRSRAFFNSIKSTSWPSEIGTCNGYNTEMKTQILRGIRRTCMAAQCPNSCPM